MSKDLTQSARWATERGLRFARCCAQLLSLCRVVMAAGRPEAQDHTPENGFTPVERPAPRLLPHIDGSVLPSLGGFGKHQKQLVVLTWIPALFIGFSQFSDYFLLAQPNGTCVQPLANESDWTAASPPVTVTSIAPSLMPTGNGTGHGYGDGVGMLCACKEWRLELQTGLSQNVVTKVTSERHKPIVLFKGGGGIAVIITTASLRQLIDTLPTDPRTVYLFIYLLCFGVSWCCLVHQFKENNETLFTSYT